MKEKSKRLLAWLISFAMVLNVGAVSVVAEESESLTESDVAVAETNEESLETENLESVDGLYESTDTAVMYSGLDGDMSWSISEDGVLTISGTGDYENAEWTSYRNYITSAVVNVSGITSTAKMFYYCDKLTSIDLSGLDTSNVTDMSRMFSLCSCLTSVDLSGLNTSNVTDMSRMFSLCSCLTSIDLSEFDTSNVKSMAGMFSDCHQLTSLDLSGFDTSNVTDMNFMFGCCWSLKSVNLSSFDTSNVTNMYYMFTECESLSKLDVSNFDTSNVVNIARMFDNCGKLEEIDVSGFDTSKVTNMSGMFNCCKALTSIDVSGFDTSNVTDMSYMFLYCTGLTSLDVRSFDTSSLTTAAGMLYGCSGLCLLKVAGGFGASLGSNISLPETDEYFWANANAVTVTTIDPSLDSDMWYVRYADGQSAEIVDMTETVDISGSTVSLSTTSYTYNGSAKKPTVTVTCNDTTLVSGTDYTVSYSNNTNAGTATVTVTGQGNYTGTVTKNFTINKASQTVSVKSKGSTSIKAGKTTTWTAKTSGNGTITYSTTASSSVGTVNSSTGKVTAKGVGTIKVYATAAATSNYKASSKTLIATITVGLTTPTISSVTQSSTTVTVKWSKITGAKGYYVYRSTSKSGTYTQIKKITSGSTVSYKDTSSKTNGKTYYYKVYAYSGSTKSSASSAKSITYMKGTVSSLTNTSSGITVKWSKVSSATGYYVYRKASTASSYTLVKKITSNSTVSYTDTGVKSKNGTTYTYYVQPYKGSSKGAYSTKKTVRMTAVTLSSVKNSSSKKMTVKWSKNTKATGYKIEYSTSSKFTSSTTKTVTVSGAATVSRTIGSLTKNKKYYVRICSYKTVSGTKYCSAWSSTKSVKISK